MFGNKYGKTLTVILIIVIIAIIGLLIFFGIDVYRKFYIEEAAGDAVENFRNEVDNGNLLGNLPVQDQTPITNIPSVDLNTLYQDDNPQGNGDDDDHPKYMGYDMIGIIEIPATDVEYPIIASYDASIDSLNVAIVKLYPSNKGLNEVGNTVFAGHNYRNGTFFSNNKRLEEGDKIYITDISGERVEYEIYDKYETGTGDSSYMNRDTQGRREISLTTCTDDTRSRLIILAREVV